MLPSLPTKLLLSLSERIEAAMGLYFPPERLADLERKIRLVARELAFLDLEAFVRQLLASPFANDQVRTLAGYLTIGETYFYREPQVWDILQNEILPSLIADRTDHTQSLRFWSAACSTGEEPYTLAMTLTQAFPQCQEWRPVVLATDVNPKALCRAQAGVYSSWSFRVTSPEIRGRFFQPVENKQFAIRAEIQKMVTFAEANLVDPSPIPNSEMMDVILCRNVLFYFSPERARRVLERCYDSLVDGGWLIVSPVETTYLGDLPFVPVLIEGNTVYRKKARLSYRPTDWSTPSPVVPQHMPRQVPSLTPLQMTVATSLSTDDQKTSSATVTVNPDFSLDPVLSSPPSMPVESVSPYEQARALYEQGHYEQVIAFLVPRCGEADCSIPMTARDNAMLTLLARAYANQGCSLEARAWCEKAIANDRFDAGLYYLYATVLLELGCFA